MKHPRNFTETLKQIDDLNEICDAFRKAYLRANPQAKSNKTERRTDAALAYVQQHYNIDLALR